VYPCSTQGQLWDWTRLPRALPKRILKPTKHGACPSFPGSLSLCLPPACLSSQGEVSAPSLNPSPVSSCLPCLVALPHTAVTGPAVPCPSPPRRHWGGCEVPPKPLLRQGGQTLLPQPLLTGRCSSPEHSRGEPTPGHRCLSARQLFAQTCALLFSSDGWIIYQVLTFFFLSSSILRASG